MSDCVFARRRICPSSPKPLLSDPKNIGSLETATEQRRNGTDKKNSFSSVGNQCVGSKFKIFYSSYHNSNSYATISISIKTTYLQKKASTAHGETHLQTYLKLRYLSGMVTFSSETLLF